MPLSICIEYGRRTLVATGVSPRSSIEPDEALMPRFRCIRWRAASKSPTSAETVMSPTPPDSVMNATPMRVR